MLLTTSNKFGKIFINAEAIKIIAAHTALDCYGVVDLVSRRFSDNFGRNEATKELSRGVNVQIIDNLVYVELFVVLKVGVNIEAVKKSLQDAVKFSLETFTGMSVKRIHIDVVGIRV
ncbi:MAG: Asp23/Gls24 family envelope stress response protein [Clostridia bacterium]|nr:Asp23/Gls24 family envelope stress response protein [Clostridia bacterium]